MVVRKATTEELDEIFVMGYDAWGGNLPLEMYLESCHASYKYRRGVFYVLETDDCGLAASCIVYPVSLFGGAAGECAVGVGSLATAKQLRNQGNASRLLEELIFLLEAEGVDAIFLHADIDPKMYERFGFNAVPKVFRKEPAADSVPMLRLKGARAISAQVWAEVLVPEYF